MTCGGKLYGVRGTLRSPNYPKMYPKGLYCKWRITLPKGYSRFSFRIKLDLGQKSSSRKIQFCRRDHLSITQFLDGTARTQKYCQKSENIRTYAFGRKVIVRFWAAPYRQNYFKKNWWLQVRLVCFKR